MSFHLFQAAFKSHHQNTELFYDTLNNIYFTKILPQHPWNGVIKLNSFRSCVKIKVGNQLWCSGNLRFSKGEFDRKIEVSKCVTENCCWGWWWWRWRLGVARLWKLLTNWLLFLMPSNLGSQLKLVGEENLFGVKWTGVQISSRYKLIVMKAIMQSVLKLRQRLQIINSYKPVILTGFHYFDTRRLCVNSVIFVSDTLKLLAWVDAYSDW